MALVALAAILLGGSIGAVGFLRHYRLYREKAGFNARMAANARGLLDLCRVNVELNRKRYEKYRSHDPLYALSGASGSEWWRLNYEHTRELVAYHDRLAEKYRRVAWRPGSHVDPDPPMPFWDGHASPPADIAAALKPPALALDPADKDIAKIVDELRQSKESRESESRRQGP
jgi:hypothetical protein